MSLIGADVFIDLVRSERTCWIRGIKGGHKTSLAFMLTSEIMQRDRSYSYVISNVNNVWQQDLNKTELRDGKFLDAVVILDEGGRWLRTRDISEEFVDFCRKLNTCWIVPSVSEPYRSFRKLTAQQIYNLKTIGINASVYKWQYKDGSAVENGTFYWTNQNEIYGIYDTDQAVVDDGGIMDWVIIQKEKSGIIKRNASKSLQTKSNKFEVCLLDLVEEVQEDRDEIKDSETIPDKRQSRKKV